MIKAMQSFLFSLGNLNKKQKMRVIVLILSLITFVVGGDVLKLSHVVSLKFPY